MFVMHALAEKAGVLQSMFELDGVVEWVSCAAELENRQIRKNSRCLYAGWERRFRNPFRSAAPWEKAINKVNSKEKAVQVRVTTSSTSRWKS